LLPSIAILLRALRALPRSPAAAHFAPP